MNSRPAMPSFKETVKYWFKLGCLSFGGPAGQISMMHQELVERRRWISEHRFLHALNYTMVLPGPEAQQLATYIGWLMHGIWGGIAAGTLFILPSLFLLIGLSWVYMVYGDLESVKAVLSGIKPAVTAIVVFAVYRIGSRTLTNSAMWALATLAFCALFFLNIPFPYVILSAGLIGFIGVRISPTMFSAKDHHSASKEKYGLAVIDDDTPLSEHTKFKWSRFLMITFIGLVIWFLCMAIIIAGSDVQSTPTQMGMFFTKAALLTFGGAYAVLPYVSQGAIESGWLNDSQMIVGLALGETTPGPLIMIVTYVGYVGGWTKSFLGPDMAAMSAIVGALIATLFTFLPSFIFILAGAPKVEATRHDIKFTGPLIAITAAVVGVILNLAAFFAEHVFWPKELNGGFDWYALAICLIAFILLFRFKVGIITIIIGSALAGATTLFF